MNTYFNKNAYGYKFIMRCIDNGTPYLLYRFRSSRTHRYYIVRVEEHPHNFYGIKFYLKSNELSKYKYNILTGLNEPRPIVNTCICILLEIYKQNSNASFGFIGSETMKEIEEREQMGISEECRTKTTKRMHFYRRILNTYFSDEEFKHFIDDNNSAYVMVNSRAFYNDPDLVQKINKYFKANYSYFD